jgi:hypothetical protein
MPATRSLYENAAVLGTYHLESYPPFLPAFRKNSVDKSTCYLCFDDVGRMMDFDRLGDEGFEGTRFRADC